MVASEETASKDIASLAVTLRAPFEVRREPLTVLLTERTVKFRPEETRPTVMEPSARKEISPTDDAMSPRICTPVPLLLATMLKRSTYMPPKSELSMTISFEVDVESSVGFSTSL